MLRSGTYWACVCEIAVTPSTGAIKVEKYTIAVDPGNRLYFVFQSPIYPGSTALCTSDDRGASWACDPAAVPGETDRSWVATPVLACRLKPETMAQRGLASASMLSGSI